jgi:CheY-like chemotaxis protein
MKTILLASDSKVTLELIKVYLIDKNVRVLDVRDGVEALTIARVERPDLVLCDLRMPRLDGPGLCRELAADLTLRQTPVIILTSSRDKESLRQCREAGVRAVLLKPIGPNELYDAVQRYAGIVIGLATDQATRLGTRQPVTPMSTLGAAASSPPAPTRPPWWIPTSKAS